MEGVGWRSSGIASFDASSVVGRESIAPRNGEIAVGSCRSNQDLAAVLSLRFPLV